MHRNPSQQDESLDDDPVWKLLDAAPAPRADARFAERTLRAARMETGHPSWWQRVFRPVPIVGLCGATAAIILALNPGNPGASSASSSLTRNSIEMADSFSAVQEAAEIEALIAAVDQMDDFSDHELVTLIGF